MEALQRFGDYSYEAPERWKAPRLSALKFFMRYPIFLLAFGPPIFRPLTGIDATKGVIDFWAVFQIAWLGWVAIRAILRLATMKTVLIPKRIRGVLRPAFVLGFLFLVSSVYSTSPPVTAAYALLNLLTLICVAEFLADAYSNPPDWVQCIFQLRLTAFLLLVVVLVALPFDPSLVLWMIPGAGIRLLGGSVAPMGIICPVIAIISAYSFLNSLESRVRSSLFFVVGLAGTLVTQSRGAEIALALSLLLLVIGWARTNRRTAYLSVIGSVAAVFVGGAVLAFVGPTRIWSAFNRGQDIEGVASASGRTEIWEFVLRYCIAHPQGMGYIAGFRSLFKEHFALGSGLTVSHIGATHNSFVEVLAGAGWLALALYLLMLVRTSGLAWRAGAMRMHSMEKLDHAAYHARRCSLLLLAFCLVCGMETSEFSLPLRAAFYYQYIIIAIILGASANLLVSSRGDGVSSSRKLFGGAGNAPSPFK